MTLQSSVETKGSQSLYSAIDHLQMDQVTETWLLDNLSASPVFIRNRWKPLSYELSEENIGRGNGFISELRRLTVLLTTDGGAEQRQRFVLKVPASDEARRMAEQHRGYSHREARMYRTFLEDIQRLAERRNLPRDALPNIPACLLASAEVPVALVLEDLTEESYENVPFERGLSIEEMELALSNLAAFHAAGLALRQQQQLPGGENLNRAYPFLFQARADDETGEYIIDASFQKLVDHVATLPGEEDLKSWLTKEKPTMIQIAKLLKPREPLATVTHADSSVINFLFSRDPQNGRPVSCKMIDFQVCMFSNPGTDVAFLLFSSTEPEIRRKHGGQLVAFYLDCLKSRLRLYGVLCDLDAVDCAFWNDWKLCQQAAFYHLVMCGLNWFFGHYGRDSTRNRLVAVAKDVREILDRDVV